MTAAFEPKDALERQLAEDRVVREGLAWGEPRSGHHEALVIQPDAILQPGGLRIGPDEQEQMP